MAKAKPRRTRKLATGRKRRTVGFKARALEGKTVRGREWEAAQPQAQAPATPEVREPRPYTTRYPIPNEQFESLKAAAPRAKLRKITAERAKDSTATKQEFSARAMAPAALEPGIAPVAAASGSANFAGIASTGCRDRPHVRNRLIGLSLAPWCVEPL